MHSYLYTLLWLHTGYRVDLVPGSSFVQQLAYIDWIGLRIAVDYHHLLDGLILLLACSLRSGYLDASLSNPHVVDLLRFPNRLYLL